jgi:hypothetical protein
LLPSIRHATPCARIITSSTICVQSEPTAAAGSTTSEIGTTTSRVRNPRIENWLSGIPS